MTDASVTEINDPREKAKRLLRAKYKKHKVDIYDARLFGGGVVLLFTVKYSTDAMRLESRIAFCDLDGKQEWDKLCR